MEPHPSVIIDILIPVYRGLLETRRCLSSVLGQQQQRRHEVIVIDDACPEPELAAYLDELNATGQITLLRHADNLGFVASVNAGMRLHPERDLVLLNSDTEVHGDWLDRLARCADADESIGTVTPFSNNATICSYPRFCADNPLPDGLDLAELDGLFQRANAGRWAELPTAVGFCMFIRRACLAQTGLFDEQRFGLGYGEENDFCMRASRNGWRHVLCADTFVYHVGAVSFSERAARLKVKAQATLERLHPHYPSQVQAFMHQDPLAPLRLAVDQERAQLSPEHAAQVVVEQHHIQADLRREQQQASINTAKLQIGLREAEQLLLDARSELRIRDEALVEAQRYVRERETDITALHEQCQMTADALEQSRQLAAALQQHTHQLSAQLAQIHASRSWRYTKILRRS